MVNAHTPGQVPSAKHDVVMTNGMVLSLIPSVILMEYQQIAETEAGPREYITARRGRSSVTLWSVSDR